MIYLDNSATTFYKPQCVVDTVVTALKQYSFNPNRSNNKKVAMLQQSIYDTRRTVCALLNGYSAECTVFTYNTTTALNLAILGCAKQGGHVITTMTEHNSVLRPLHHLARRGHISLTILEPNSDGNIDLQQLKESIRPNTYMAIFCHTSNVNGKTQNAKLLCSTIKQMRPDIITLLDCAQSVGYTSINMKDYNVDMVAIPAHKGLHGMQGCGVLCFNPQTPPRPVVYGGTGTESDNVYQPKTLPDGLESGTQNCPSILALYSAIGWWAENYHNIKNTLSKLQDILYKNLISIDGVKLYSKPNDSGIVTFNINSLDSDIVADILSNKYDIAVRGGVHCAPLMHKWLKTQETGAVRVSVGCDNTPEHCYALLNAVSDIAKNKLD